VNGAVLLVSYSAQSMQLSLILFATHLVCIDGSIDFHSHFVYFIATNELPNDIQQ
jgi:hypothetical protein